jgi:hypothetical protein
MGSGHHESLPNEEDGQDPTLKSAFPDDFELSLVQKMTRYDEGICSVTLTFWLTRWHIQRRSPHVGNWTQ